MRKWQNQVHWAGLPQPIGIHLPAFCALTAVERLSRITESQRFCGCGLAKIQMVTDVQLSLLGTREEQGSHLQLSQLRPDMKEKQD